MSVKLYIDSDGSPYGTHVLVIGEDDTCIGELEGILRVDYAVETGKNGSARVLVQGVPGRFLANDVLIRQLKSKRWWQFWR